MGTCARISLGGHVVFENNTFAISPEMEVELTELFKVSNRLLTARTSEQRSTPISLETPLYCWKPHREMPDNPVVEDSDFLSRSPVVLPAAMVLSCHFCF